MRTLSHVANEPFTPSISPAYLCMSGSEMVLVHSDLYKGVIGAFLRILGSQVIEQFRRADGISESQVGTLSVQVCKGHKWKQLIAHDRWNICG